ncbi:MAG: tRNA 2-selenouridine(34) synthase MnmH [Bacteroidota bacterium]|jgi:tRNA 2-selenouridine synthase
MAVSKNNFVDFINNTAHFILLDVRSPAEFEHAHIPGAYSLPLFDNEQRAIVGTTYKKQSREDAIKIALPFFGEKMKTMVETVEGFCNDYEKLHHHKPILFVHCWRGGMRSAAVAWLLDLYGFRVIQLNGGYKAYRNWVIEQFSISYSLNILGGYTGSGKTETLHALAQNRKTVIDLEGLANHKGSSFGALGQDAQPSQEMFENLLAEALHVQAKKKSTIWLEDESQRIGTVMIPSAFFAQIKKSPCYFVRIPFEERLNFIVANYGKFEKKSLIAATIRIQKRLGGLETKNAIGFLEEGDVKNAFAILLKYYDKWYDKFSKLEKNEENNLNNIQWLDASNVDPNANIKLLMDF